MKKLLFPVLGIAMVVLSACSSGAATGTQATPVPTAQAAQAQRTPPTAVALPQDQQLLIGTLKLSGAQAVTKEQAAKLLPMWQRVRDLAATTTQGQIPPDTQAVILGINQQIAAAMTSEQTKAIADMKLTRETMLAVMQEQGIEFAAQGGFPQGGFSPPADGSTPQARPQGGQGGTGRQGGQGGQGGYQGGQPPVDPQSPNWQGNRGMFFAPELYDAVIQMLQKASAG